jgi:hypothetical protein
MLGRAIQEHFGLDLDDPSLLMEPDQLNRIDGRIPYFRFIHDDTPHLKRPEELSADKSWYSQYKVILLVRDPRDVVVSNYFEYTKRGAKYEAGDPEYQGDISSYLHYAIGSLDTLFRFYNIWAENRHVPLNFMLVRYEDLHKSPDSELRRIVDFLGLPQIRDGVIRRAVRFASFENMHRMEAEGAFRSAKLRPGDKRDPDSYKTRRGEVGGYIDYFGPDDIGYLNRRVKTELDGYYGYNCDEERTVW